MWMYLLISALILAIYWYGWRPVTFWREKGFPYLQPLPIIGNTWTTLIRTEAKADALISMYNAMPNRKCYGTYSFLQPFLLVRDPELIKTITIKDFDHFVDRPVTFFKHPLFDRSLVVLKGQLWRNMRATLSPAFTGSKMRGMIHFMRECGEQFNQHYRAKYAKQNNGKPVEVDIKDLFTKYTNDVIATTAFGIKTDSFRDPNNEFFRMGHEIFNFKLWRLLLTFLTPNLLPFFGQSLMSSEVSSFFYTLVKNTLETRKREKIYRPDIFNLLMEAQKGSLTHDEQLVEKDRGFAVVQESSIGKSEEKLALTDNDIVAQVFIFFTTGFETASITLSFACYEIALNPEIQNRLQQEIDDVKSNMDENTFHEKLHKMEYLDMVISETLRKWPSTQQTMRTCTKQYRLKVDEQEYKLEPGMNVAFSVIGMQRDPKYYPDPMKFDPERFSAKNKGNIKPFTYFPFGIGPRNCIASRFALMETKVALFYMLANFNLTVIAKTQIPAKLRRGKPSLMLENGIWLGLEPRD